VQGSNAPMTEVFVLGFRGEKIIQHKFDYVQHVSSLSGLGLQFWGFPRRLANACMFRIVISMRFYKTFVLDR
jgi:hypothetical protein